MIGKILKKYFSSYIRELVLEELENIFNEQTKDVKFIDVHKNTAKIIKNPDTAKGKVLKFYDTVDRVKRLSTTIEYIKKGYSMRKEYTENNFLDLINALKRNEKVENIQSVDFFLLGFSEKDRIHEYIQFDANKTDDVVYIMNDIYEYMKKKCPEYLL